MCRVQCVKQQQQQQQQAVKKPTLKERDRADRVFGAVASLFLLPSTPHHRFALPIDRLR